MICQFFSDAVRTPTKSREESVPDAHLIAISTPVFQLDLSLSPILPTANNPLITHQVTIAEDDILRIATVIKLCIQDEISELVNKNVTNAVEPPK